MPTILNSKEQPEVDKWAVFLRPASDSSQSCLSETGCSDETGNEKKGTFIGIVGTNRWSEQGMETGYCLHKDHWGRGYATEAFEGFLRMYWTITGMTSHSAFHHMLVEVDRTRRHMFTDDDIERKDIPHLVAKVYQQNEQSVKVLRKCGGREGEMLGRETLKNGMGEVGDIQCVSYLLVVVKKDKKSEKRLRE